jgi:hypothetical protein
MPPKLLPAFAEKVKFPGIKKMADTPCQGIPLRELPIKQGRNQGSEQGRG